MNQGCSRAFATAFNSLWVTGVAHAAAPTVTECLAASEIANELYADKLRAERQQLLTCAADTCPAEIREECARRVEQAIQAIPSTVFAVKDAMGADVSAVKVTMHGELLSQRLVGTALAVDEGEHTFRFEVSRVALALPAPPAPRSQGLGNQSEQPLVSLGVGGLHVRGKW